MEKPGNTPKPVSLDRYLWVLLYLAVIAVSEKYWVELTGYGWDFLFLAWLGVTALLAGLFIAGPLRALSAIPFHIVSMLSAAVFFWAYTSNFYGARQFGLLTVMFGIAFTGIAGLIVCLALGRPPVAAGAGETSAPAKAGVSIAFTVIQAVLFGLLVFGLTAFVTTGWVSLWTYNRELAFTAIGIIGVIELAVMGWAWWKLWRGGDMLRKGLALLFAVPLLCQVAGYVMGQTRHANEERQVVTESAAAQQNTQITSYSERPIRLPGFDDPVGLEISIGLKITAPGSGMLQQPVFFHLPHGQALAAKTNYCCAGYVDAVLQDGSRERFHALSVEDPQAGPDGAPFTDDLGPMAQPWKGDGAEQTHEYSLFSSDISSLGLNPPTVCMPKEPWSGRLVAADLNVRWWMERRDVNEPETLNTSTGFIQRPGGDIGPVLRDYIVSHSSLMNDGEQWTKLVTAITPETLDKAGYRECESRNYIIRCYCRKEE
jgi:hypothetical protein